VFFQVYARGAEKRLIDFDSGRLLKVTLGDVVVKEVQPGHRGRGGFSFTPEAGETYKLQVTAGGQNLTQNI
jgi:hypothetical protein